MNDTLLTFEVRGQAITAGSKRAYVPLNPKTKQPFRRPGGGIVANVVDDTGKRGKAWRLAVKRAARMAMGPLEIFDIPLRLQVDFELARPANQYWQAGVLGGPQVLRPDAPIEHSQAPDSTKLLRAVEDAMLGVVYRDDSQITQQIVTKRWADRDVCYITLSRPRWKDVD